MSYSEEEILRSDDWPIRSTGTWSRRQPVPPQQWSAASTYATLTRAAPPPPAKPPRNGLPVRTSFQPHYSRSQHQLNYAAVPVVPFPQSQPPRQSRTAVPAASSDQPFPIYSQIVRRRHSEDSSASFCYLPSNSHSSSVVSSSPSSSSFIKPTAITALKHDMNSRRKPIPPAKPPRTSIENSAPVTSRVPSLIQSKSQRNLNHEAWNKSIDFSHVPPPEGYGNIKRSASNDVDAFSATFGTGYSSVRKTANRHIENENAHQRLLPDPYGTDDHLYDEIGGISKAHKDPMSASKIQHQHRAHDSQALTRTSNGSKHLRSRSEHHHHHPRCPNSSSSNHYDTPMDVRDLSLERCDIPGSSTHKSWMVQPSILQPSSPPLAHRVSSHDEYATVLHPPSADVAIQTIQSVIRPISQEYRLLKQRSMGKSVGTRIEAHYFATIDAKGKKISVKAKTMDRIPLLQDCAILTDPVSKDFFAQPESRFSVLCRTSKISSDDGERSLRRTKHHQFVHVGTAERKKKKLSFRNQDQNMSHRNGALDMTSVPNNCSQKIELPPTIIIKPIELDIVSDSPVLPPSSPFDDRKEWAEIESLMASFDSTFKNKSPVPCVVVRESKYSSDPPTAISTEIDSKGTIACNDLLKTADVCKEQEFKGLKPDLEGVKDFLFSIDLPDYTPLLISNGFDDVRFMGSNVMEESDLLEVGIRNPEHASRIVIAARKRFPRLKMLGKNVDVTVENWLETLNLKMYADKFMENGFTEIEKIRKIWEVELQAVLDISKVGHRKRILANLGERSSLMSDLGLDDLDFDRISCVLNKSPEVMAKSPELLELLEKRTASRTSCSSQSGIRNGTNSSADSQNERLKETIKKSANVNPGDSDVNSILSLTIASVPQWRHDPCELADRRVDYTAFYLGSTLVQQLLGIESTRESIKKLKETTKDDEQIPTVILSIAYTGVKFIDHQTRTMVCEHEIRNIHCACQDTDDFRHFAYITKDHESNNHYCHVFSALNLDLATEVILTLGQAFEVAYQMALGVDMKSLSRTYQEMKKSQHPAIESKAKSESTDREDEPKKLAANMNCKAPLKLNSESNEVFTDNCEISPTKCVNNQSPTLSTSRIRSKSTEGHVEYLKENFEFENVPNLKALNTNRRLNQKGRPIPPAKPPSLSSKFPASPAATMSRSTRSQES